MKCQLDELFRVLGEVQVMGRTVYLRTLTDIEDGARVDYALEKARKLRRELRNNKRVRERKLGHIYDMRRDELEQTALSLHRLRLLQNVNQEVFQADFPEPDPKGGLESVLDARDENEEIQKSVEEARREWIDKRLEGFREELKDMSLEDLQEYVIEESIARMADAAFGKAFETATVYYASYKDPERTEHWFASIDQVEEANPSAVQIILDAYRKLDRFSWDQEELKN